MLVKVIKFTLCILNIVILGSQVSKYLAINLLNLLIMRGLLQSLLHFLSQVSGFCWLDSIYCDLENAQKYPYSLFSFLIDAILQMIESQIDKIIEMCLILLRKENNRCLCLLLQGFQVKLIELLNCIYSNLVNF